MLPRFLSPGPLFALEMTTSVRRIRYFVMRVMYATLLLFALFIAYQSYNLNAYASSSEINAVALFAWTFFQEYSWLQIFAVVVAGPALAAGTIASEREHRTIEYLFTTTLSNAEIIFGKLLSRLVHLGYLVLAGVPILSIAMLMGGIAPQAIVLLMIMTLSTALTVSIISITVSVWTARARDSVVRAYLVIFFLLFLPLLMIPLNGTWVSYLIFPIVEQFQLANPFWVLNHILVMGSATNTAGAWDILFDMVRNQAIVCVLGMTASTLMVRRVHLKAGGSVPKKRRNRRSWFRPAMGDRPVLWKEISVESVAARLGMVGRIAMLLILIGVLTPTVYMFHLSLTTPTYNNRSPEYLIYSTIMGAAVCCGGLLLIGARAAGSITSEKERDCWVSLLTTPLEPSEIIIDKIAGNLWAARGIFIVMAIIWGLGIIVDPGFIKAVVFMAVTFLLLAVFASALGVMFSLWCRTSIRAMSATLATGLFVGGGYLMCCGPFMVTMQNNVEFLVCGCIPFLLAFPGIVYAEGSPPPSQEFTIFFAYATGMIGYAVASGLIINGCIKNFESLAGRVRILPWDLTLRHKPAKPYLLQPMPALTEEAIQAEIVQE